MAKVFKCSAVYLGCGHVVRADTEEEILRQAAEHARKVHGLETIDESVVNMVRAAITDESVPQPSAG